MGRRHLPDEYTLLCERCGYDIESLPKDAACPECGKPIRESLPEARLGTPWQASNSPTAIVRCWFATLTSPRSVFDSAKPDTFAASAQRGWTLFLAALGPVAVGCLISMRASLGRPVARPTQGMNSVSDAILTIAAAIILSILGSIVLGFLTWIEERGIRFWGPRRGWRITPAIAKVICAHASVGWLLGSALSIPAHLLGLALLDWTNHNNAGSFRGPMQLATITLPALALIAGMLTFEVLVYIGMNRMKFANRARPEVTPPLDASMPTASVPSDSFVPPRSNRSDPPFSPDTPDA